MKFRITGSLLSALLIFTSCSTQREVAIFSPNEPTPDHSGMWLMPQLTDIHTTFSNSSINLRPNDIYNPENASIHNSIVRINIEPNGGGTGSFVSPNGLILTNHHVAYDGIATASGLENNFLQSGFYAEKPDEEIPLAGYTLHIPILQKDVTNEFNNRIPDHLPYRNKAQLREQVRQEMIEHHQTNNPDLLVEVSEILSGNRFILSTYKVVRDVRLVYAPEEAIGKFGGDIDNWMWPRHTGDY
ncbi:S46 family peptidase, partial [Rhodohalobacter halophilus]|uniref:S46 family peptidase n=1 Tax=Rhodohalobacter halophilus TaxID=1812810 RepID=UPI000A844C9E